MNHLLCAEAKNVWGYTSTHPYVFRVWYLFKYRDNFHNLYLVSTDVAGGGEKVIIWRPMGYSRDLSAAYEFVFGDVYR